MPKSRSELTAAEVVELHALIDRKLDRIGIETQPEIAQKILELTGDPESGPADYAKVLKTDSAMTGRLLKMANSAFFAQRAGVSTVERACVVLGMERLKAVSLGFYLGRAAAPPGAPELSRRVWGRCLFRACLGVELARFAAPGKGSEAFVIGLMLDCGLPLMPLLVGDAYERIIGEDPAPGKLFHAEYRHLPFTHGDVAATLCKRWRLPELLSKPIEWRFVPPGGNALNDINKLQRIAHYTGAVHLNSAKNTPRERAPLPALAAKLFGMREDLLAKGVEAAGKEYALTGQLFSEIAETMDDPEAISVIAHEQLLNMLASTLATDTEDPQTNFVFDGMRVEMRRDVGGYGVIIVNSADGEALISYRFIPHSESPESLLRSLGIEPEPGPELERLGRTLSAMAAGASRASAAAA